MSRRTNLLMVAMVGLFFLVPGWAMGQPSSEKANPLFYSDHNTVPDYNPPAKYEKMIYEKDVMVPMRDGVRICVDICRPDSPGKFPALLSMAVHNKDLQGPDLANTLPPQPAWSHLWWGGTEVGDTKFFVSRGYVHVLGQPRGIGKSDDGPPNPDYYDLIEWMAQQPWCDGNVGMSGLSAFGAAQFLAAQQQPPHLKAIMPQDPGAAYGFRDANPGGVIHVFGMLLAPDGVQHIVQTKPGQLPPPLEAFWKEAISNPDFKIHTRLYNILTQKGQLIPRMFYTLVDPYDSETNVKTTEDNFQKIKIPAYTGSGWYALTYKTHFQGFQSYYPNLKVPKKLMIGGPGHYERPFHENAKEILRWYDYWLKGIDTGIMKEPSVKLWVMGANQWMYANDWPIPQTQWAKLYLDSWERLKAVPFIPGSREGYDEPDAFAQMPPTQTNKIQRLRFLTEPLPKDTLVAGPIALTLYASLDQDDTNWLVILKDVGPDESVRTAREGELEIPTNLPERELTRGWLKASLRELDPQRSKPWKPWQKLTRESRKPVVPGEINEYQIEIMSTANLFKKGHRICLEITSLDLPTGMAGATNVEYIPYHIGSSKTVLHKIYHNAKYPSQLLLPIIPENAQQWIGK